MEYPVAVDTTTSGESPQCSLTYEEENSLRYVAGYVCRKLWKCLESSSLPNKDDMVLSLMEVNGDEMDDEKGGTLACKCSDLQCVCNNGRGDLTALVITNYKQTT